MKLYALAISVKLIGGQTYVKAETVVARNEAEARVLDCRSLRSIGLLEGGTLTISALRSRCLRSCWKQPVLRRTKDRDEDQV